MLQELLPITIFLLTLVSSYLIFPVLIKFAAYIGLVDRPGGRKIHAKPIPLTGGLGIALSLIPASLFFIPTNEFRGFFSGAILLLIVGLVDDYKGLGHWQKFLAQGLAVLLMVSLDHLSLHTFGNLLGLGDITVPHPALSMIITIFCVIGVINAINMIDGLDGLAGGVSLITFCSFSVMAALNGYENTMFLTVGIAGAVFGYLRYNWRPAKIFMGDAGSLLLGYSLAYMTIKLTQQVQSTIAPVCALIALAVPITDTLVLMTRRAMQGKNPFKADRYHLHHLVLRHVSNKKNTVKFILTITFLFNAISISAALHNTPQHYLFLFYLIYFLLIFRLSFLQPKLLRLRLKFKRKRQLSSNSIILKLWSSLIIKFLSVIPLFRENMRYPTSIPGSCHTRDWALTVEYSSHGGDVMVFTYHENTKDILLPRMSFHRSCPV